MIDPTKLNFRGAPYEELEEFALFCVAVAGKNAITTAEILEGFLTTCRAMSGRINPFRLIRHRYGNRMKLRAGMRRAGFGCYDLKSRGWWWLINKNNFDLRNCTVEQLEECPGIGMKTSRFFILHSRENARVACLDTHILKHLRAQGHEAPDSTPPRADYLRLEKIFLDECDELGVSPAVHDLAIWNKYSQSREAQEESELVCASDV